MDITVTADLARAIQAELDTIPLTYTQIAKRGGPAAPTMTKILRGEGTISPSTAEKLERALEWEFGTVARLARGQARRRDRDVLLRDATADELAHELARRRAAG